MSKTLFEIYEPQGTYNGARYISFSINDERTILREAIGREIPAIEQGGIISLPTDCNASAESVDMVAREHDPAVRTIGKFLNGRYVGNEGTVWDEDSLTVEAIGITGENLIRLAEDLGRQLSPKGVLVKDYSNGKILFVQ